MRKVAIVAALAAFATGAQADGFGSGYKDSPAAYSWTGFYVGVNGGSAVGSSQWAWHDLAGTTSSSDQMGGTAGGQAGYNWQFMPHGVAGIEGSVAWIGASGSGNEMPFLAPASADRTKFDGLLADVSARLGYADDNVFAYAKGGVAFADRKLEAFYGQGSIYNGSSTVKDAGWLVGAGVELKAARNWTVKAEWNHIDFGTQSSDLQAAGILHSYSQTLEVIKVGLNYKLTEGYTPLK